MSRDDKYSKGDKMNCLLFVQLASQAKSNDLFTFSHKHCGESFHIHMIKKQYHTIFSDLRAPSRIELRAEILAGNEMVLKCRMFPIECIPDMIAVRPDLAYIFRVPRIKTRF